MKTKLSNNRGSALLISLAIMAMLSLVALMAVNRSQTDFELSYNQLHEEQAFYLAEAGSQEALAAINADNDWRTGFYRVSFGGGIYSVNLVDSSADSTLFDTVVIRSTGFVDGGTATVELETVPVHLNPFKFGLFGDAGISLDKNTCTDSYNSDSGSYAATVLDSMGDIGSNGTIISSKEVSFGGDISVATEGGISLGVDNTVTGDTTSTADSVDLDIIPDSEYDWARDNGNALTGLSGAGYAYDHGTKDLIAGSYANIVLTSGVYYFDDITLGQGSTLSLAPGADVTLYVNGNITLGQASTVNDGGSPADLMIFSRGTSFQFDQDNIFYGVFYGPDAHIQYDQTTEAYGALVGNTLQLDAGACFHYDRTLANITKGTTGEMIAISWGENY